MASPSQDFHQIRIAEEKKSRLERLKRRNMTLHDEEEWRDEWRCEPPAPCREVQKCTFTVRVVNSLRICSQIDQVFHSCKIAIEYC